MKRTDIFLDHETLLHISITVAMNKISYKRYIAKDSYSKRYIERFLMTPFWIKHASIPILNYIVTPSSSILHLNLPPPQNVHLRKNKYTFWKIIAHAKATWIVFCAYSTQSTNAYFYWYSFYISFLDNH